MIEIARAIYPIENKDMLAWAKIDYDEVYVQQVLTQDKLAMKYGYQSAMELKQVTFAKAVASLDQKFGKDIASWQWGRMHQALFDNKVASKVPGFAHFYNRKVPVGGSRHSISCMRWNVLFDPFEFKQGPSLRMLVDMSLPGSEISIPMGASENPFTDRFDNLLQQWVDGGFTAEC